MPKQDYYEILGVSRDASQQEIKRAYRRLAQQHHPDKNPGDSSAEEKFKQAAEAYTVLSDPDKRARYDRFGHAGTQGFTGFDPEIFSDFSDILGDFFGFGDLFGSPRGGRRNYAQRGADLRYDLKISFEEAAFGVKTKIQIPRHQTCEACQGSGAEPGTGLTQCPSCKGAGQVRYQQGFFSISRTCSQCRGTGKILRNPCRACQGTGRVRKEKVLEIKIPAGVEDGSRLRISGEGEAGTNGGPSGDLYVVLHVEEHSFFERQENNIYCEVPIGFAQAALGAEISIPTLDGEERLQIPEGTQTGTTFRLRGKGIVSLNGRGKGDQFVSVRVVTPEHLTKDQRQLLEKFAQIRDENYSPQDKSIFEKVKDIFG
ncbi:MAG TPA: molecular chaperone DnaJ [Acidobacteriota bacterium]|jgi:molecular chaperone DnaJ|nr:molecular chaperone DnaJ [Acidobacteriota bacterium]